MHRRLFAAPGLLTLAVGGILFAAQPASAQQGSNLYNWSGGYGGSSGNSGYSGGYNGANYANPANPANYSATSQANTNQSLYPAPVGRSGWENRPDGWQYFWNRGTVVGAYDPQSQGWYSYNAGSGWARPGTPPWKQQ